MESKTILIVEDDPEQFSLIEEELHRTLKAITISGIHTESEFYSCFSSIIENPPDLILMDMMLRWTDPAPPDEMPPMPPAVKKEGYYRAGIRCTEKLMEAINRMDIPILLFTVLGQEYIEEDLASMSSHESIHISYLPKTARIKELLEEIQSIAPVFLDHLVT